MEIGHREKGKWNILDIRGNIQGKESERLKQLCDECIQESKLFIVANFKDVNFIDSTGLGSLIHCHQKMKESRGNLVLMNLSENIYELFEMTSVDKLFQILDSEEEIADNI